MGQLYKLVKPHTPNEKKTRSVSDTIMVTPKMLEQWKSPPFQRQVRENEKVRALAEEMKTNGGVWPGTITLGLLDGILYLLDGQHRKRAFLISGVQEGYTDVRTVYCTSMAEMGEEFVELNSYLSRMRPDDFLRGLEHSIPGLRRVREACPFVGYDFLRCGENSPIVSMAAVIRAWRGSAYDVPASNPSGLSVMVLAEGMTEADFDQLIGFLQIALNSFGRDSEYYRLWSALNLTMCMWLYRRLVLNPVNEQTRYKPVSKELFKKALMSVSADSDYVDWLLGRHLGERDRVPTYSRLKSIFASRFSQETGSKAKLPSPPWAR